jgi:major membrane immunogen (membrane-anchored lipoprotein)
MKKLLLLTIVLLSSCTSKHTANTDSICPCTVTTVSQLKNGEYYVTFKDSDEEYQSSFSFYTRHLYNIGDTIK